MAKVEVPNYTPRVVDEDRIVIDLQAALYPDESNTDIRMKDISFEVKTALGKVIGVSAENGLCDIPNLVIDNVDRLFGDGENATILVTAIYNDGDVSQRIVQEVTVNISAQVQELFQVTEAKKQREADQKQQLKEEEDKKTAEAERIRSERARYEAYEPERKSQIKASIIEAGKRILSTEAFQVTPFNTFREHADLKDTYDTVLMVAKKAPARFIDGLPVYKLTSWAGEAMCIAVQNDPGHALPMIKDFYELPWAQDVLRIIAKRYPKEVIESLGIYCSQPWCLEFMMHLADAFPQAVFETVLKWEFYTWARELALKAAAKAPEFVGKHYPLYINQPWSQEIYEKAISFDTHATVEEAEFRRLLQKDIVDRAKHITNDGKKNGDHFAFFFEHCHHPRTRIEMLEMAKSKPKAFIAAIGVYKSVPWAREVMAIAAGESPIDAISAIESYMEMPWANEIFSAAIARDKSSSTLAIQMLSKYAAKPWAKSLVLAVAKAYPDVIFEQFEYIEHFPFAEEVVLEASRPNPELTLGRLKHFEHHPWADSLRAGVKRLEGEKHLRLEREKNNNAIVLQKKKLTPDKFVEWLMTQRDLPLSDDEIRDIVIEIERLAPGTAMYTFHHYGNRTWGTNVLLAALRKDPSKFCNIKWEYISRNNKELLTFYIQNRSKISLNPISIQNCLSNGICESFMLFLCRGNPAYMIPQLKFCASQELLLRLMEECNDALTDNKENVSITPSMVLNEWKERVARDIEARLEKEQNALEQIENKRKEVEIELRRKSKQEKYDLALTILKNVGIGAACIAGIGIAAVGLYVVIGIIIEALKALFGIAIIIGLIALAASEEKK